MYKNERFYGEINLDKLTEKILLGDEKLVVGLARWNEDFGKNLLGQNLGILSLNNGEVAYWLAKHSNVNGWGKTQAAQNFRVLKLYDEKVAWELADKSENNGWGRTPAAQEMGVLRLCRGEVALRLAEHSGKNGWGITRVVQDRRVHSLCGGEVGKLLEGVIIGEGNGDYFYI